MNCNKRITLTGYTVRCVDLREPKPRKHREDVYVIDKEMAGALAALGLNAADMIEARYERGGYHVTGVERIPARRVVNLDLLQLWAAAADEAGATHQTAEEMEVADNG